MVFELYNWGAATLKPISLYSTETLSLTTPGAVERSEYVPTAYTRLAWLVNCLCKRVKASVGCFVNVLAIPVVYKATPIFAYELWEEETPNHDQTSASLASLDLRNTKLRESPSPGTVASNLGATRPCSMSLMKMARRAA